VASTDEPSSQPELPSEQNEKAVLVPALTPPDGENAAPAIEPVPCKSTPPPKDWRARIADSETWLKVVVAIAGVIIAALALIPAFVSMSGKNDAKPTQSVDARGATNTVTIAPGAHVGDIKLGEPEANKTAFEALRANQEKMLRAIAPRRVFRSRR